MNATLRLTTLAIAITLALPSCVSKKKFQQLTDEKAAVASSLAESQNKVKTLEGKVSEVETELTNQKSEMSNQKSQFEKDIDGLRKGVDEAKSSADAAKKALTDKEAEIVKIKKDVKASLGMNDVPVSEVNGDLVVSLANPVTFSNGSSRLNKDNFKVIDSLAVVMKNNPTMHLIIEGYTDSKMFPKKSKTDNWQLSYNRALMVAKRLIKQGINPNQLTVAGRAEFDPIAPNDTKDGRAQNRRTIAKPKPSTGAIYKLVN